VQTNISRAKPFDFLNISCQKRSTLDLVHSGFDPEKQHLFLRLHLQQADLYDRQGHLELLAGCQHQDQQSPLRSPLLCGGHRECRARIFQRSRNSPCMCLQDTRRITKRLLRKWLPPTICGSGSEEDLASEIPECLLMPGAVCDDPEIRGHHDMVTVKDKLNVASRLATDDLL
jgi:hypothetical protein